MCVLFSELQALRSLANSSSSSSHNILSDSELQKKRSKLFSNFKILINRETFQESLEFIILSLGGTSIFQQNCCKKNKILQGFSENDDKDNKKIWENDEFFTHQIIDRPIKECDMLDSREYVQPQWVYDCLNAATVLPTCMF